MLVRTPIQSPFSVQNARRLFAVSVVVMLVVLSVVVGLEISVAAVRPPLETLKPTGQLSAETVDRTRKADRLKSRSAVRPNRNMQRPELKAPAVDSKLPVGCEPSVSPLAQTKWSKVIARCVS
jgi:hypothetical protein